MDLTKNIQLLKPLAGLSEFTLREPVIDEVAQLALESVKFGGVRAFKNLLSKIGPLEIAAAGQLGARDFKACQRFIDGLMEVSSDEALEGDEAVRTLASPIAGVTELKLREPTLDEISRLTTEGEKLGSIVAMRNLIATMNKLEPKAVGRVGLHDFKVCEKYLEGFFD